MLPRPRVSPLPIESLCSSSPLTMYVMISISRWGCAPNPRWGCTKSSLQTRMTPKLLFPRLLYSAKLKWNLDFNQLLFVHAGSSGVLPEFPNHCGGGSETYNFDSGITRADASRVMVRFIDVDDAEQESSVVVVVVVRVVVAVEEVVMALLLRQVLSSVLAETCLIETDVVVKACVSSVNVNADKNATIIDLNIQFIDGDLVVKVFGCGCGL
mmetsp:Transcript_53070/g.128788  ORF Transcript_53070/g.128788 Transcript_53070/m.128788 type:complete len:212 (+) Transcript_53070:1770-2405(+)